MPNSYELRVGFPHEWDIENPVLDAESGLFTYRGKDVGLDKETPPAVLAAEAGSYGITGSIAQLLHDAGTPELWVDVPPGMQKVAELDVSGEELGRIPKSTGGAQTRISVLEDWIYDERRDYGSIVLDATAPSGRGRVFEMYYTASKVNAPDNYSEAAALQWTIFAPWRQGATEVYVGWIQKYVAGWEPSDGGDKETFLFHAGGEGQNFWGAPNQHTKLSWFHEHPSNTVPPEFQFKGDFTQSNDTWYLKQAWAKRPASYPGTGQIQMWARPWTGSAWGAKVDIVHDGGGPLDQAMESEWRIFRLYEFAGTFGGGDGTITGDQQSRWDSGSVWFKL